MCVAVLALCFKGCIGLLTSFDAYISFSFTLSLAKPALFYYLPTSSESAQLNLIAVEGAAVLVIENTLLEAQDKYFNAVEGENTEAF